MNPKLYSFLRWLRSKGNHAPEAWCKADVLQEALGAGFVAYVPGHARVYITPAGINAFEVERKRREADEAGKRG